jgi:DME family drug/metabolite transporter
MRGSNIAIENVKSIGNTPFFTTVLRRLISKERVSLQWGLSFILGALGIVRLTLENRIIRV